MLGHADDSDDDDDVEDLDDDDEDEEGDEELAASDSEINSVAEEEKEPDDLAGWGATKGDYYSTDKIETEQDALDEEAEARRIQQKRLKTLREADFGFDEAAWRGADADEEIEEAEDEGGVVTEVLPQLEISPDMGPAERLKLLRSRYPEFEPLSRELLALQPLHVELSAAVKAKKERVNGDLHNEDPSVGQIKLRALSAYLGTLAMYFALLTSAADRALPMAPHELREHEIMDSLVTCKDLWTKVQDLEDDESADELESELEVEELAPALAQTPTTPPTKKTKKLKPPTPYPVPSAEAAASLARRAERQKSTEARLAALSGLSNSTTIDAATRKTTSTTAAGADDDDDDSASDLGDAPALLPHEAAAKAKRKKSLRFYTSQQAQAALRRAGAGRAAGGDDDLPYRERFRDKVDRLNREATARGAARGGAELGDDDSGSEGEGETNAERRAREEDDGDDLAGLQLEERVLAKKAAKGAREAAHAAAREVGGRAVRQVEAAAGEGDGRREIGWKIEANKGLTARRGKDVRNPRVKKRKRYEDKKKKLASSKPIYKGGEGRGGYAGELTGIKKGLVRSTKLS